ncbi:MAG TPA: prenyltransferase/squalene oxidase repeat-containing protein [Planctomycetota bacterium]|nr:prenyltransferase/squalene oxidase repeat-containing protein [Planctomycetota bacterium]HRR80749.1 prenyltransferase/squalene oxidase repeat-containing protein [Planctomycetota bacterium]HRT97154.1 prenyltransferase/squalene oxidase repeat-containing protein [Planctomycetota bacterium]
MSECGVQSAECGLSRWALALTIALAGCARVPLAERGPKPRPITPPARQAVEQAIQRGVQFLLTTQNKDGSWGSARRTKGLNIYAPVPGAHHAFHGAVTALAVAALIEAGGAQASEAIDRGEAWLVANLPRVRRAEPAALYNCWSHAYGIQALVRLAERHAADPARRDRLLKLAQEQVQMLERYESVAGGWGYYDFGAHTQRPDSHPTSFTTAAALVALHEAKAAGVAVPNRLVERAMATMRRQRSPDFTYLYSENHRWWPRANINLPGGSLGRSQAGNIAMRLWGDTTVTDGILKAWLNRLFARNDWLGIGAKRPIPHESWFQVAGYFYYFGHYYAALCIGQLDPADRPCFQGHLAHILLARQEKDGSWWDYPLYDYHQAYGTAFALMSLVRCLPAS